MLRKIVGRFAASAAVVAVVMTGLLGGAAQAQVAGPGGAVPTAPGSQIQSYTPCGYYITNEPEVRTSNYRHCGPASRIEIRVRFNYGWWGDDRTIWVGKGRTNLSKHPALQGNGLITDAWCTRHCW